MKKNKYKGATSMIVVIFFALLAGILVLSFASIMITNMRETTNYSLSQSALDAAQAGVEDAKILVLQYEKCIASNSVDSSCSLIKNAIEADASEDNCDLLRNALGRDPDGEENETRIRTETNSGVSNNNLDLAYTCVKVNMTPNNFLGTLDRQKSTKLIPLRNTDNATITKVKISWFDSENERTAANSGYTASINNDFIFENNFTSITNDGYNQYVDEPIIPPVLNVGFFQAQSGFLLSDFYTSDNGNYTNRGFLSLRPRTDGKGTNSISNAAFSKSVKSGKIIKDRRINSEDATPNSPIDVKCGGGDSYRCYVEIGIPGTIRDTASNDIRFLLLSVPYSAPDTSYSVEMYGSDDLENPKKFKNAQIKVDSTGRANSIFRRVESRIETANSVIPMPKYAVSTTGNSGNIEKSFEVTKDRWCAIGDGYVENNNNNCLNYLNIDNPNFLAN